jgi:hypothetical protein
LAFNFSSLFCCILQLSPPVFKGITGWWLMPRQKLGASDLIGCLFGL